MTIAERIRIEKRSAVTFDAARFMEMIEEWFTTHDYDQWVSVKSDDCYKQYPRQCEGTLHKSFCERYPTISYIGVPPEYLKDAVNMLMDEGFSIYRDSEHEYKVSLEDVPYISYGYNTWYKVNKHI